MLCVFLSALAGCSYQFQNKTNPLHSFGVQKIYVQEFENATFRPGLEQLFTSAMIREIEKAGSFRIVNSKEAADAVLTGRIKSADVSDSSHADLILPGVAQTKTSVAAEYNTTVVCEVILKDRHERILFSQSVSDGKKFPGALRTGDEGATVPLINESEQRIAIQYLSSHMMASVYQRMVDTF